MVDMASGFSPETLIFLFLVACVAGMLDTLAGGGGLLTLPALIISGVPPLQALGTNKLQGSMGTATSSFMMFRKKRVFWRRVRGTMLAALIGSCLGTTAVQFIDTRLLTFVIPAVLLLIALYFLFSPAPSADGGVPRMEEALYRTTVVPAIGWYDGMFGPGTGSFFALSGVSLRGLGLIDATAVAKTLNFSTNIAALAVFVVTGKVLWLTGAVMMGGQMLGAWAGSHCLLRIQPKYLRLLVVAMCLAMLVKYFSTL